MPSERLKAFMKFRMTARGVSAGQTCRLVNPFGCCGAAPVCPCADMATDAAKRMPAKAMKYEARFIVAPLFSSGYRFRPAVQFQYDGVTARQYRRSPSHSR